MNRRKLFNALIALPTLGLTGFARAGTATAQSVLLQVSPVAGFQYYDGPVVWDCLRPGDRLLLARESGNPRDERAVAVYWHRHKIGYLPRRGNTTVAQMLDRRQALRAEVTTLHDSPDPWQRVQLSVTLERT